MKYIELNYGLNNTKALFLSLVLVFILSCSKETDDSQPIPFVQPEIKGFDYFLNTNEEWYFHIVGSAGTSNETHEHVFYSKVGDTTIVYLSDTFSAAIISESGYVGLEYPDPENRDYYGDQIYFYDKDLRLLRRYKSPGTYLIDFKKFDFYLNVNAECDSAQIIESDIIQLGKNQYRRYVNTKNQQIIEGIALNVNDCELMPPYDNTGWVELIETRYSSDEFSLEWSSN